MTSQPDISQLIAAHGERFKKLVAKRLKGKALSESDLAFLAAEQPTATAASFDSLAAAAAVMGVPKRLLQTLKREGAPGFRGSRVYPEELRPYLEARAKTAKSAGQPKDREALECEKLQIQIDRLKKFRDLEAGASVSLDKLIPRIQGFGAEFRSILQQRRNAFTQLCDGKSLEERRALFDREIMDASLESLRNSFADWEI